MKKINKLEKRFNDAKVEARTSEDGEMILTGRAITYNSFSENLGGFKELIKRGGIKYADTVTATVNHNNERLVGKLGVNMELEDREDGLYYTIKLPNTTEGRDLFENSKVGLSTANSFEFIADVDNYESGGQDELDTRTVTEFTLYAVNPLIGIPPAYKESFIAEPRSYTEFKESKNSENRTDETQIPKGAKPAQEQTNNFKRMDKKELLDKRASLMTELETVETLEDMKSKQEEVRSIDETLEALEVTKNLALRNFENTKTQTTNTMESKLNLRKMGASDVLKVNMNEPELRAAVTGSDVEAGSGRVVKSLIEHLAPKNIINELGAQITYNAYDTILPIADEMTGSFDFKGENVAAPVAGYTLTKKTLTPKRVPITVPVSKTALLQDAVGLEADIFKQAIEQLYKVVEKKVFSADALTAESPAGLLALATTKDIAGTGVSDNLLAVNEYELADAGVDEVTLVSTGLIQSELRKTPVVAGSPVMLYNPADKDVRGLSFKRSAHLADALSAKDCALMGDFSKLHINFFGATDITIDPYTRKNENIVEYQFEFNVDWALSHPASMLFLKEIVTNVA